MLSLRNLKVSFAWIRPQMVDLTGVTARSAGRAGHQRILIWFGTFKRLNTTLLKTSGFNNCFCCTGVLLFSISDDRCCSLTLCHITGLFAVSSTPTLDRCNHSRACTRTTQHYSICPSVALRHWASQSRTECQYGRYWINKLWHKVKHLDEPITCDIIQ